MTKCFPNKIRNPKILFEDFVCTPLQNITIAPLKLGDKYEITWNAFSVGANTVIDWLVEFNRAKVVASLQSRNKNFEILLDS